MQVAEILARIRSHSNYRGQIKHIEVIPAQEPKWGQLDPQVQLAPSLIAYLRDRGLRLYSHQAEAVNAVERGQNVILVTPTASGKTLAYNLPVLSHLLNDPQACALYLFPTKSLARDQWEGLQEFPVNCEATIYDGDTSDQAKPGIREKVRILITNPDMLHQGILPNHLKWHRFLSHLKFVIVDEVHTYRGVFGTHVGHVLRRLRRLVLHHGADPQFVLCSATIANPQEHAERMTGLPFVVIDNNGAPRSEKTFVLWQPPWAVSYRQEMAWLLHLLVLNQVRTIAFARSRQTVERVGREARRRLAGLPGEEGSLANQIISYRAGYLPKERRALEKALFHGELTAVVATNALELGIDVGHLDVSLIAGFPGTVASLWQQAGRAGRRRGRSLTIFMAVENPLDQFLLRHPSALFSKPAESALTDPANPYILGGHVLCAAHELTARAQEAEGHGTLWPPVWQDLLALYAQEGRLAEHQGRYYYLGQDYPADQVNLRSSSSHVFQLRGYQEPHPLIGIMDGDRVLSEAHPGAVYLHQGETYVVRRLDLGARVAFLEPAEVDYYTVAERTKATQILGLVDQRPLGQHARLLLAQLQVTTRVTGFARKQESTGQLLGREELELPEQVLETLGLGLVLDNLLTEEVMQAGLDLAGGIHAVEHATIGMLPLFTMGDRNDLGGLSTPQHHQTGAPTIFIHDAYSGGVGYAQAAYQKAETVLEATLEVIAHCRCESGCLACIHSPKCSNFNRPLDKRAAILILRRLIE